MAKLSSLPLWTDAWIAETNHLTHCERGLYLDLIVLMWRSPDCRVPNDDAWLMRHLKLSALQTHMQTHELLRPLINEFCQTDGNYIFIDWLVERYDWCKAKSAKNTDAANSMWAKKKASSKRNASKTEQNSKNLSSSLATSLNLEVDSESEISSLAFDTFWVQYPHKVGKAAARKSFVQALKKVKAEDLMAALHRYTAKTDDRPWCNPATWLNQERWLDQPAKTNGRNGPHETLIDKARRLYDRAAEIEAAKAAGRADIDDGSDFFGRPDRSELSRR